MASLHLEMRALSPRTCIGNVGRRNLMTFGELQSLLWRERRIGIRQWRALVIRRIRSRFIGGGFPRDFDHAFRGPEARNLHSDILATGKLGRPETRGREVHGANNRGEDGPYRLNWGGDGEEYEDGRLRI